MKAINFLHVFVWSILCGQSGPLLFDATKKLVIEYLYIVLLSVKKQTRKGKHERWNIYLYMYIYANLFGSCLKDCLCLWQLMVVFGVKIILCFQFHD